MKYTESERQMLAWIQDKMREPKMLERYGDDFKMVNRKKNAVNACEFYMEIKYGMDERQVFTLLHGLVEKGAIHLDELHYYIGGPP